MNTEKQLQACDNYIKALKERLDIIEETDEIPDDDNFKKVVRMFIKDWYEQKRAETESTKKEIQRMNAQGYRP